MFDKLTRKSLVSDYLSVVGLRKVQYCFGGGGENPLQNWFLQHFQRVLSLDSDETYQDSSKPWQTELSVSKPIQPLGAW